MNRQPSPRRKPWPAPRLTAGEHWARHRRKVVALCLGLAVLAGLRAVAPADADARTVLTVVKDLPAGHVLSVDDLGTARLGGNSPLSLDPSARDRLVGRTLAVPWPQGMPLHERALAGSDLGRSLPKGWVAVSVTLEAGSDMTWIKAGDLVDVVLTTPREDGEVETQTLASDARVMLGGSLSPDGGWLGGSTNKDSGGRTVVLSLPRTAAPRVAGSAQRGAISLVVTG